MDCVQNSEAHLYELYLQVYVHVKSRKYQLMGFEESRMWQWQRPPSLLLLFIFFTGALLFFLNVFQGQHGYKVIQPTLIIETKSQPIVPAMEDVDTKGFLLKTKGCRIPEMEPVNPIVQRFIFEEKPVVCNNGTPALVESNLTSLYILNSSFTAYEINDTSLLRCCYTQFWRVDPSGDEKDGKVKYSEECKSFNGSVVVNAEFVSVKCTYNSSAIYNGYFSFAPSKSSIETFSEAQNKINVLIFGIDSISRLNFHRQMPKTARVLKGVKAVELLGYNKVADNTFPNLMPVLTGLSEEELKSECWPNTTTHFDNCPFVWKKYNASGYVTAFAEDSSWMGIFNYQRRGFKRQPTHYYWDTYNYETEKKVGNTHRLNVDQCIGSEEAYKTMSKYAAKFVKSMQNYRKSYFAFFWTSSLSHDLLNKPKLGDEFFASFIAGLNEDKLLENTFFIFLSDHGMRWGDIRSTFQGRIEERLPFVHIYLPEWYKNQYPMAYSNLVRNSKRLTTPYDIHATLEDLLDPYALTKDFLYARQQNITSARRFYSLFDAIPPERTCNDSNISSHWCTCEESVKIDTSNPIVLEAANFTVDYINRLLIGYADCVTLELDRVMDSHMQTHHEEIRKTHPEQDYMLTLRTKPGNAIFEATVRTKNKDDHEYAYEIIGTISRINLYGKQSLCMTDFHLKLYCFCRQLL